MGCTVHMLRQSATPGKPSFRHDSKLTGNESPDCWRFFLFFALFYVVIFSPSDPGKNKTIVSFLLHDITIYANMEKHLIFKVKNKYMQINQQLNGSQLHIALIGRLDTLTTSDLSALLENALEGVTECILELSALDYVSSAGLRVLLTLHKQMLASKGQLWLHNVQPGIMDILEMTGFAGLLSIKNTP